MPGGGFIRANKIDDPFFFDLIAFRAGLSSFCPAPTAPATVRQGVNFFRGVDTLAIALELPRSFFGTNNIGVWARTALDTGVQVDRMGKDLKAKDEQITRRTAERDEAAGQFKALKDELRELMAKAENGMKPVEGSSTVPVIPTSNVKPDLPAIPDVPKPGK